MFILIVVVKKLVSTALENKIKRRHWTLNGRLCEDLGLFKPLFDRVDLKIMPRPIITPEQRQQTRQRIREAASRLVAKRQVEDVSARAVAAEAGVSVGTIYKYYENLTELAQSLWKEPVEALRQQIVADAKTVKDPVERVRVLLEHYVRFANEKHRVFKGAFLYVRPESRKKPESSDIEEEVFFGLLHTAIIEGQVSGQIRDDDPKLLAQTLWAGIHGALALPITLELYTFSPKEEITEHMVKSLMLLITIDT